MRASIICDHFPERQEEAFDDAFKYAEFGGYEDVIERPAYAEYLARRKRKVEIRQRLALGRQEARQRKPIWRDAEAGSGPKLPTDYRKFLVDFGACRLRVRLPEHSAILFPMRPSELANSASNLFNFIARTEQGSGHGRRPISAKNTASAYETSFRLQNPPA